MSQGTVAVLLEVRTFHTFLHRPGVPQLIDGPQGFTVNGGSSSYVSTCARHTPAENGLREHVRASADQRGRVGITSVPGHGGGGGDRCLA